MNRFEQKSMSLGRKLICLLPILAFVILFVLFLRGIGSVGESTLSKQQESLETALERSISQCYAVEGCYPPSLEYLEQHYGLLYDEDRFFIDYEYYGSNLLPDLENVPALCMLSEIDEETYCTYLYLYDGHLKELFMREGASLGGQVLPAGTDIMDLQEFSLSYASDDLIRISLRTASGEDHTFYIHVHCNTTTE